MSYRNDSLHTDTKTEQRVEQSREAREPGTKPGRDVLDGARQKHLIYKLHIGGACQRTSNVHVDTQDLAGPQARSETRTRA